MEAVNTVVTLLQSYWVVIVVVVVVIALYYVGVAPYTRSAIVAQVGDLPGPKPLPFLGSMLDLVSYKGQMHLQFNDYYKKYGRLFATFLLGRKPLIVMSDLEMVKELLVKRFQSFHDRPVSKK